MLEDYLPKKHLSVDFEEKIRRAVRPADPSFELTQKLLAEVKQSALRTQIPQRTGPTQRFLWAGFTTIFITGVVLINLIFTPQVVLAAIQKWVSAYVPGLGFVETTDSIRMIPGPVVAEQPGGAMVTIAQAFATATQTILISGESHFPEDVANPCKKAPHPDPRPYLTYQDTAGKSQRLDLLAQNGLVYPPLPPGVNEIMVHWPWHVCDNPEFLLSLHFVPAPPETIVPVVAILEPSPVPTQVATATNQPGPSVSQTISPTVAASTGNKTVKFNLGAVIATTRNYTFGGTFSWETETGAYTPSPEHYSFWYELPETGVQLLDAHQKPVPFEPFPPEKMQANQPGSGPNVTAFAYQTLDKNLEGPLTLRVPYLIKTLVAPQNKLKFDLDTGANVKPGQSWALDLNLSVEGKPFRIVKAEYKLEQGTSPQPYEEHSIYLTIQADPAMTDLTFAASCGSNSVGVGQGISSGGNGGGSSFGQLIKAENGELVFSASLNQAPEGLCTFTLEYAVWQESGEWDLNVPIPEP